MLVMKINEGAYVFSLQGFDVPNATEAKIKAFEALESGWNFGEGTPFSQTTLDSAISLNKEAVRNAFFETDAFPGANGEVMVTIYSGDDYLEFIIEPDASVTFRHERDEEEIDCREGLSLDEAKTRIGEFRKWKSSESSIGSVIMTAENEGLLVSHSGSPAIIPESQSSKDSVSAILAELSVPIS